MRIQIIQSSNHLKRGGEEANTCKQKFLTVFGRLKTKPAFEEFSSQQFNSKYTEA